jgi:hypothetical protein
MNRTALIAALAVGLAAVLAAELAPHPTDAPPPPAPPPPVPAIRQEAAKDDDGGSVAAWVDTILARPLLSPGRRPAAEAAGPADAAAAGQELPRLTGIVVTPAGRRAIFAAAGTGRPIVVSEGGSIAGYVVRSIAPAEVTLSKAEGDRVIRPSPVKGSAAAEQAAAAGAPPP